MQKELVICTWSYSDVPANKFKIHAIPEGRLGDSDVSIAINLP